MRKAGIKKEVSSKRHKYNLATATPPMLRRPAGGTLPNYDTLTADGGPTMFDDDLSGLSVCLSVCL